MLTQKKPDVGRTNTTSPNGFKNYLHPREYNIRFQPHKILQYQKFQGNLPLSINLSIWWTPPTLSVTKPADPVRRSLPPSFTNKHDTNVVKWKHKECRKHMLIHTSLIELVCMYMYRLVNKTSCCHHHWSRIDNDWWLNTFHSTWPNWAGPPTGRPDIPAHGIPPFESVHTPSVLEEDSNNTHIWRSTFRVCPHYIRPCKHSINFL